VLSDRQQRELFHFLFLEWLLRTSGVDLYVLKGGVNLRFFHASPRYSEDMDLDVDRTKVAVETLKKNGYKILDDAAFRRVLKTAGIADLRVNPPSKAKHTETTQRFALSLVLASGQELPTKIEISGRGIDASGVRKERIDVEVARRLARTAYYVAHYDADAAARQKVGALAGRAVTQARDLFDLYLLESRGGIDLGRLAALDAGVRQHALENASEITYEDFEGQVVEYLEDDAGREFGSEERFEEMQRSVLDLLERSR
jgi:predicted nucleotidyltransferase component of viral defense system